MAMRQYSAYIPDKMNLVGNVANYWRTFKRDFLNYSITSRLSKEVNTEYQTSDLGVGNWEFFVCLFVCLFVCFLATIGQDLFDIYDGLEFDNEEDKMVLEIVMKILKDFFVGETHEAFESYKFHLRKQEPT